MDASLVSSDEIRFLIAIGLSVFAGLLMGLEREARHKDAGISTHILVIMGSMLFTYLSMRVDPASTSRIAAQVVSGIGFLGAGLIIKDKEGFSVRNLTTAASLWYAAAIGMAFGFGFYLVGLTATCFGVLIPRIPHLNDRSDKQPQ